MIKILKTLFTLYKKDITKYSKDEFIYLLKKCGITGMSGNDFPTYLKYDTNEELNEREKYWISCYPNLVNLTQGGDGCVGFLHDEKTKEKLRKINLGRKHTASFKEAMSKRLKGVSFSEEHKAKIALANTGRKASAETRNKLSESHKGIKQSDESRRKRSEAIKAWWAKRKSIEDIVKS